MYDCFSHSQLSPIYFQSVKYFRVTLRFLSHTYYLFFPSYESILGHICPSICPSTCQDVQMFTSWLWRTCHYPLYLEYKHYGCSFLGINWTITKLEYSIILGPRLLLSIPTSGTGILQMGPTSHDLESLFGAYKNIHAILVKFCPYERIMLRSLN